MKTLVIFLFGVLSMFPLSQIAAQNLDKYYTRRVQEGGDIFFIFPNEDFKNSVNRSNFFFDLTIREGSDSATINFTYYSKDPAPAISLVLITHDDRLEAPAKKIYIDFVKKKWEHRCSVKVPFAGLQKMISTNSPLQFEIVTADQKFVCETKAGKWQKYADALSKIFYIFTSD
ncbi:MAG: hypothetical protein K9H16_12555 [Bacteroidales bacterium]|nr:hypothetical protein [Bacteroidales bacterium]